MSDQKLVESYQRTHYDELDDGSTDTDDSKTNGYASDTVTCPVAMGKGLKSLITHLK